MSLSGVRPGDLVRCDLRGATFYALVREHDPRRGLQVSPIERRELPRGVVVDWITARQVIGHWRKSRAKTSAQRRAERHDTDLAGVL